MKCQVAVPYVSNSSVSSSTTSVSAAGNIGGSNVGTVSVPLPVAVPPANMIPLQQPQQVDQSTIALSQQQAHMLFAPAHNNQQQH